MNKYIRFSKFSMMILVSMLLLVLMSGCGKKPEVPTDDPAPPPVTGEPVYGGTLTRVTLLGDPDNLDPIVLMSTNTRMVTSTIFDSLLYLNAEEGKAEPGIAEEFDVDGLVYTFKIREGVKFHNGREVTAEDIKYSLERLANPANASPNMGMLKDVLGYQDLQEGKADGLEGIEILGSHSVRITLDNPNTQFLFDLAHQATSIVPKEEVERTDRSFSDNPVGTGPFKFKSWVQDNNVTLDANPDYFRGRPYLDELVFRVIKEASTREAEFDSGKLDMFVVLDTQYQKYKNHPVHAANLVEVPELFTRHWGFHNQKAPFDDVRVRQALNYAIDKEAIINVVQGGKAFPAVGYLPTSNAGFDPALKGYEYNPEKAKQLMTDAGYPDGFHFNLITTEFAGYGVPVLEAVIGYFNEIGVTFDTEVMTSGALSSTAFDGDYEVYTYSQGGWISPVMYLRHAFHSSNWGNPGNRTRYKNDKVDQLLDEALATDDFDKMIRLVREADKLILEDAPMIFLNYNKAVMASQPWVRGVRPIPTDIDLQPMHLIWIDPSAK